MAGKNKSIKPARIEPVKLICGFIYRHPDTYISALEELESVFSPVEFESEKFEFTHTAYYEREMGNDLERCFVSFEKPLFPDQLSECKLATNGIEQNHLSDSGGRTINIDPGFVGLAHLALASTKDYAHRLYLSDGIYGEVSMIYENRTFIPLAWTYPDYRTEEVIRFLLRVRESLKEHIIILRQKGR
jgi:hypothetical protein